MKATAKPKVKKFEPFTIELTFESPKEAAGLFALLNHYDLIRAAEIVDAAKVINASISQGNVGEPEYMEAHGKLCCIVTGK